MTVKNRLTLLDQSYRGPGGVSAGAYDAAYFHGATSGYPQAGYREAHPDWDAWVDVICRLTPSRGTLLDLGCAYGYLVEKARQLGFTAYGLDFSGYALRQEAALRPFLVQAGADNLPLPAGSCDVVALFDVLEHLDRPWRCLQETERVLARDGLLIGATPDPLFFDRAEPTHCHERPPAFWIRSLEELGFEVRFRFSGPAFNFQFAACRRGSRATDGLARFQHDYIGEEPDIVAAQGIVSVPRTGWGALAESHRPLAEATASLYLYNPGPGPAALNLTAEMVSANSLATLRLRLDDLPLAAWHINTEATLYPIRLEEIPVPEGGHHLYFDQSPAGRDLALGRIELTAVPLQSSQLALGLPFDLFQRYRLCAEVAAILEPATILDVGGLIGDRNGHLAVPGDFLNPDQLPALQVLAADLRQCDHWAHVPGDALQLPFADGSFDLVLSLDVLEHIPGPQRRRFLRELARVAGRALIVGSPEGSPDALRAEGTLSRGLMKGHSFLQEHLELGLPEPGLAEAFLREQGFMVTRFPSGHLPAWLEAQVWTQHFFRFPDLRISRAFNRLYNETCYRSDLRPPSYRGVYLAVRPGFPLSAAQAEQIRLLVPGAAQGRKELSDGAGLGEVVSLAQHTLDRLERALHDSQFLANSRIDLAGLLAADLEALRRQHNELARERDQLAADLRRLRETPLWRLALQRLRKRLGRTS